MGAGFRLLDQVAIDFTEPASSPTSRNNSWGRSRALVHESECSVTWPLSRSIYAAMATEAGRPNSNIRFNT